MCNGTNQMILFMLVVDILVLCVHILLDNWFTCKGKKLPTNQFYREFGK